MKKDNNALWQTTTTRTPGALRAVVLHIGVMAPCGRVGSTPGQGWSFCWGGGARQKHSAPPPSFISWLPSPSPPASSSIRRGWGPALLPRLLAGRGRKEPPRGAQPSLRWLLRQCSSGVVDPPPCHDDMVRKSAMGRVPGCCLCRWTRSGTGQPQRDRSYPAVLYFVQAAAFVRFASCAGVQGPGPCRPAAAYVLRERDVGPRPPPPGAAGGDSSDEEDEVSLRPGNCGLPLPMLSLCQGLVQAGLLAR